MMSDVKQQGLWIFITTVWYKRTLILTLIKLYITWNLRTEKKGFIRIYIISNPLNQINIEPRSKKNLFMQ